MGAILPGARRGQPDSRGVRGRTAQPGLAARRYAPRTEIPVTPERFAEFTRRVVSRAAAEPDVLGVVALGSTSGEPPLPDAWSDHDLFLVTRPGAQERFRTDPGWLPDAERLVLWHRETAHGLKAIWDDGHLAELAVFDPDELALARVNRYRVLLDRSDVAARLRAVRVATTSRTLSEHPDDRWLVGQLLGALLVGAARAARGERLSGHQLVRGAAVGHLLMLAARHLKPAAGAALDDLDPFRRAERGFPTLAAEIEAALRLPVPAAARALLDAAERALRDRVPWPGPAAEAVRRRLAEAALALGA